MDNFFHYGLIGMLVFTTNYANSTPKNTTPQPLPVLEEYIAFDDGARNQVAPAIIPPPEVSPEIIPDNNYSTQSIEENNDLLLENNNITIESDTSIPATAPFPAEETVAFPTDTQPSTSFQPMVSNDIFSPSIPADPSSGSSEIALLLNDGVNPIPWQGISNRIRSHKEITLLYARLNYRPLWTDNNGKVTRLAAQVIRATQEAYTHGLRPETYHTDATSSIQSGQQVAEPEKFDIIVTDAFVTYKKHLTNGFLDPKIEFQTWNTAPETIDFLSLYLFAFARNQLGDILKITDKEYEILRQGYIIELQNTEINEFTPIPAKRLTIGDTGEAVSILRERLGLDNSIDIYDDTVYQAVKAYQRDNRLGADGIAGRRTLRHLNRPPENRLEKLAINMERYRWGYTPEHSNYVWVNIPAYQMAVKNEHHTLFESKVIVGRSERQTPIFSDTLEHVVLAPYWNVPSTIFEKDKLPVLKKNPHAFGKNMQVINTSNGKIVSPDTVNWNSGGKGYRLRQKPGGRNALGRMKFLFPNRHAIYLHDTPTRKLFKRSQRAYSSGCVRVERAEDFALFLLNDMGYDRSRIKKESRRSREKWVNLSGDKQYPVFLNYYTAWVDSDQQIRYSKDIYHFDKSLTKRFKQQINNL